MNYLFVKNNKIICPIAITGATSKIRVKRRKDNFGEPVAVKSEKFSEEDYVEWQISYFLPLETIWNKFKKTKGERSRGKIIDDLSLSFKNETIAKALKKFILKSGSLSKKEFLVKITKIFKRSDETLIIKKHKNGRTYVRYELSDLFKIALENKIINKGEIKKLIDFNSDEKFNLEEEFITKRIETRDKVLPNFKIYKEVTPLVIYKINDNTFVEIIRQHKQRAVGFQSMVYFCSYLGNLYDKDNKSLIGRPAESNEIAFLPMGKEELMGIAQSFIIASKDHAWDMKTILKDIIKD